jgi:tRNA uridine 5-carboxymethylaminomethyl modification enzyme
MDYEVIVVGAGHAGIEAALATSKLNAKTLLITLDLDTMGNLPCNPSIGGSAKGIVVREIDALGGFMGKAADVNAIQIKMLNTGKGPAVQCLRSQIDKLAYPQYVKNVLLHTSNLTILVDEVTGLIHDEKQVTGILLKEGRRITAHKVILTTGTYMEAKILIGHVVTSGGPDGLPPSLGLSPYLKKMGLNLIRLKTGTPPRIKHDSIDYSKMTPQYGCNTPLAFSYTTEQFLSLEKQVVCHLLHTQKDTHQIIKDNLKQSSMFSGLVTGVGPRYCPSIEDKIVRFSDKERHQLFLEPETRSGDSIYLQGFSTSMPREVQKQMVASLPGLENAVILKDAYAIEYDALDPLQFDATLEMKKWKNLYGAGQIIGTSGYEEAAGLGLIAGINAVRSINGKTPIILRRDQAYIGVMIDDLVTKGVTDPYRLLSSRAEYRLLLRHDNADLRLTELGYHIGLIERNRYDKFLDKKSKLNQLIAILAKLRIKDTHEMNETLMQMGLKKIKFGTSAKAVLMRPEITYAQIRRLFPELNDIELDETGQMQLEIMVKYEGYIVKQIKQASRNVRYENITIPTDIDYLSLNGLALEARHKLNQVQPLTIGQASRVSGVNPSDIAMLVLYLKRRDELSRI